MSHHTPDTHNAPDSIWHWNRTGWRCPVCGKGNSPDALGCQHCQQPTQQAGREKLTLGRHVALRWRILRGRVGHVVAIRALKRRGITDQQRNRYCEAAIQAASREIDARRELEGRQVNDGEDEF